MVCGIDDPRLLEINHKNGSGRSRESDVRRNGAYYFYEKVLSGVVPDAELRCANHNVLYEYEVGRRYDFTEGS